MLKLDLCNVDDNFWTSGNNSYSTAGTLLIKRNLVQWRSEDNNRILKQFECESVPLAAVFFPFRNQVYNNDPVVSILVTSNLVRFHTIEGQIYELVLNFIAKNIYPSSLGLLVERESLSLSRQIYSPIDQQHCLYSVTSHDGPIRPILSLVPVEHDNSYVVCVWDKYVCMFNEETGCLTVHQLLLLDSAHYLARAGKTAAAAEGAPSRVNTAGASLLGESSMSFASNSSRLSSDSSLSVPSLQNQSDHSIAHGEISGLSVRSSSTSFSSLKRRPKKYPGGSSSPRAESPRPSSPISLSHQSQSQSRSQVIAETSLLGDMLDSRCHAPLGELSLPAEVQLGAALTSLLLDPPSSLADGTHASALSFSSFYDLSFSTSPAGSTLLHLLCRRSHELKTHAFSPCQDKHRSPTLDDCLKLLCVRPLVSSFAHIHMGQQQSGLVWAGAGSPVSSESRDIVGTLVLYTQVGSNDLSPCCILTLRLCAHLAAIRLQGGCELVLGAGPSIAQVDLAGSLANCPLAQLLATDACTETQTDYIISNNSVAGGRFISTVNHFQLNEAGEGDRPQHRPNIALLLSHQPSEGASGGGRLFTFSLPCWSFLHAHPLADQALPTDNSKALGRPRLPLHSLFSALCSAVMLLLCKLTATQEIGQMESSGLLGAVAVTLKVLLALENRVSNVACLCCLTAGLSCPRSLSCVHCDMIAVGLLAGWSHQCSSACGHSGLSAAPSLPGPPLSRADGPLSL